MVGRGPIAVALDAFPGAADVAAGRDVRAEKKRRPLDAAVGHGGNGTEEARRRDHLVGGDRAIWLKLDSAARADKDAVPIFVEVRRAAVCPGDAGGVIWLSIVGPVRRHSDAGIKVAGKLGIDRVGVEVGDVGGENGVGRVVGEVGLPAAIRVAGTLDDFPSKVGIRFGFTAGLGE